MKNEDRKIIWKELNDIIGFTAPTDGLITAATGKLSLNIIKLDEMLNNNDPDYDANKCTYKGKPDYSPAMYIEEKFGKRAVEIINILIK